MGLSIKALPGAAVVVLPGMLSKNKNYYLAGLIPLFPAFALIAHYIVVTGRGVGALRTTVIFGMWAVIPYFVCLASLWVPSGMVKMPLALGGAVACWCLSAWLLIALWSRFH